MESRNGDSLTEIAGEAFGGVIRLFSGSTVATIVGGVGSIAIARLLGSDRYGIYMLSIAVPGSLLLASDFGVSQALTRFIAYHRSDGATYKIAPLIKTGLIFKLLNLILLLALGLIFPRPLSALIVNRPEIAPLVRISMLLLFFQGLLSTVSSILLGFDDTRNLALLQIVRQFSRISLSVALILLMGVLGAVLGYMAGVGFTALLALWILYTKHYANIKRASDQSLLFLSHLKSMVSYGLPLYGSTLIISALSVYQSILLAYHADNSAIGSFTAALNFSSLVALLANPVSTVLFPSFSKLKPGSREAKKLFSYSIKYASLLIIPSTLFVALNSSELVNLIYGSTYIQASRYLTFYILLYLYTGLGYMVVGSFLNGVGETKVNMNGSLIYATVFLPLAYLLTKTYSVEGLITAVLASSLPPLVYKLHKVKKKFAVYPKLKDSLRIYMSSMLAAIPLIFLKLYQDPKGILNFFVCGLIYFLSYITILPLIRAVREVDLENLKAICVTVKPLREPVNLILSYEKRILSLINR